MTLYISIHYAGMILRGLVCDHHILALIYKKALWRIAVSLQEVVNDNGEK